MFLDRRTDISGLEKLFIKDGLIVPVPYADLKSFTQTQICVFCHKHAIYQLPTTELIEFLKAHTKDVTAIEIGAGNGCIGRNVGIKMTDNKMQTWDDIKLTYLIAGQPVITYGQDVETIPAIDAIKRYKPETVIACWVTHKWVDDAHQGNYWGVQEEEIFTNGVKKYVHVGNWQTHVRKPILKKVRFDIVQAPWIVSRSMSYEENVIFIFEP